MLLNREVVISFCGQDVFLRLFPVENKFQLWSRYFFFCYEWVPFYVCTSIQAHVCAMCTCMCVYAACMCVLSSYSPQLQYAESLCPWNLDNFDSNSHLKYGGRPRISRSLEWRGFYFSHLCLWVLLLLMHELTCMICLCVGRSFSVLCIPARHLFNPLPP